MQNKCRSCPKKKRGNRQNRSCEKKKTEKESLRDNPRPRKKEKK